MAAFMLRFAGSVSSTTLRIANPVGIWTTGLSCPGATPTSASLNMGGNVDSPNLPRSPPAAAVGSIDSAWASVMKFSPASSRVTIRCAFSAESTTMTRSVTSLEGVSCAG